MDHYIDIKLLPDPEFASALLMNALFSKFHRALVEFGCNDVGISFPDYNAAISGLGERVRLHGSRTRLESLMAMEWLKGMQDHVHVSVVAQVPKQTQHIRVRRVQAKSSAERIRRRQMRRHNLSYEEALARIPDSVEERLKLPFLTLRSHSTKQQFRLFVHQDLSKDAESGNFNAYGLSRTATLPLF